MKYKTIKTMTPMNSNDLGKMWFDGWEFITVTSIQTIFGNIEYLYYFKEIKHNFNANNN